MTIEEIKKKADELYPYAQIIDHNAIGHDAFVKGAMWMQEQYEINEEELDKLAKEYAQIELGYSDTQMQDFDSWHTVAQAKFREVCEDFKAGFRKALKQ